jgi:glyoxylase-like metal-dependent hydrolase (beta-lactamase superfamily II)
MNSIALGDAQIHRVEELSINSPMAVPMDDKALLEAHGGWLIPDFADSDGHWQFVFQSWILLVDGRVVLIDPCNGNGRPHMSPMFDRLHTPYIERFTATGIKPDEVDYVFCTHLHHDHCGWNTQLRDGRYVPTFPRARYLFAQREYERWDTRRPEHRVVDYNVGVFERSVLPVMEAGQVELFDGQHRVSPSISIEPAYGHTEGHSILHLESQSEQAYFTGDAFHHPLQLIDPSLWLGGDNPEAEIATRRRLIALCLERNALIIPAHFPPPYAGRLRRQEGRVVFEKHRAAAAHGARKRERVTGF